MDSVGGGKGLRGPMRVPRAHEGRPRMACATGKRAPSEGLDFVSPPPADMGDTPAM